MGTYYVRTNGSDTTGDGSSANPWASLNKAITSIPLAGGHTVLFGPGTYTQDGNCNKSYASLVTFKPEIPGAEVHFTNSTTNSVMALTTPCSNYRFENIYFDGSATSGSCIYPAVTGTTISNVEFYRCTFTASGKASQYCVKTYVSGTCSIAITFTECTFFSDKVNSSGMIYAQCASPASQVVSYTFDRCTASNTAACNLTNLEGVTNTVINGGSWNSAGIAIALGKDAATGYATAGCQVRNAVVQSSASHALLLGGGSDGAVVDGCDITMGNNGVVIKGANARLINCIIHWPDGAQLGHSLLLKGATAPLVQNNRIYVKGAWFAIANSDGAALLVSNAQIKNNVLVARAGGSLCYWTSAQDGSGNIIDANVLDFKGGARLGSILAAPNCQTLADLRAAWSGYGDGSNDAHTDFARRRLADIMISPANRI